MNEELISMSVMIAGRSYPLRVKEADTESIQQVVDELNEKIKDFQLTYINKDKQDCLAMSLLTYAVDLQKTKQSDNSGHSISNKIDLLEKMIDNVLS